jgi:hypothetical protein
VRLEQHSAALLVLLPLLPRRCVRGAAWRCLVSPEAEVIGAEARRRGEKLFDGYMYFLESGQARACARV